MKSTITIKDLSVSKELDHQAMSAVRGGLGNQSNATGQLNKQDICAPVSVGNGSEICGPATFQVDSNPTQTATNYNTSSNEQGVGVSWYPGCIVR
jgi:hypothetical protein